MYESQTTFSFTTRSRRSLQINGQLYVFNTYVNFARSNARARLPLEQEGERCVARMTPHPPPSPRRRGGGSAQPPEPWRWARDELKLAKTPLPGAPNVVVLQTTAGWRKAPALAQRVYTRGLASLRSISLKNTMNTAGFRVVRPAEA